MVNKHTKIVCTIGPASDTVDSLVKLVEAGMNVCRLNFSHGTHEQHAELIKRIREASEKTGEPLCILQDLQGPKIRVGELPEAGVELVAGKPIIFTSGDGEIPKKIPVTYPNLHEDVKKGQRLLLDDGLLEVVVKSVKGEDVNCEVITGGTLKSHKGLNLPETDTQISAITTKDEEDIAFGVLQGVDWIALSFVRKPEDVQELRKLIGDPGIKVIAKIEKPEAVANMDAIIAEVDGIMVARGDLGIEMPAEKVPVIQKELIAKCRLAGKPVIVATQMLDSMIKNPRATRAEISDIANAVIDHADATMLSGETASGAHPLEAVKTMTATIMETEKSKYDDITPEMRRTEESEVAMTNIASILGRASNAKAIVVASLTGDSARLVSRERPDQPIYVMTTSDRVVRQLNVSWGVRGYVVAKADSVPKLIEESLEILKTNKLAASGDEVVIVAGEPLGESGSVNLVELRKI
ncbi:pyruvate kinase [Candidatus Uhrbacteria bacterium]|jgi:pyruvate kinase|nr:MAG: pyruvate kinase [Candidatus Uhrbacteria bacterium]